MTSLAKGIPCLVCGQQLTIRLATGRKSQKTFLMLICSQDGRHFRGFVTDRRYVDGVLSRLEGQTPDQEPAADLDHGTSHLHGQIDGETSPDNA